MLIQRLELENIKSYVRETIEFKEGVNFVCGANGSGKSTLVEAVGYALFNVSPGTLGTFLRDGATRGTVRLQFLADDDKVYLSERRLNRRANTDWTMTDVETGILLDLHNEEDVLDFLRRQALRLGSDRDLDDLFQTIIGVRQGMFATPFLETPALRKTVFDRILGIEGYREAYRKTSHIAGALDRELKNLHERRDDLMKRLADYEATEERVSTLAEELATLQAQEGRMVESLATVAERLETLESRERELLAAERRLTESRMNLAAAQERVKHETARLAQAGEAARICEANQPRYDAYESAKTQESEQLARQKAQQILSEKRNRLERDRSASEARIQGLRENIAKQETELREEGTSLAERLERLIPRLTELERETQDADGSRKRWEGVERRVESLQEISAALDGLARFVSDTRRAIRNWDDARAKALERLNEMAETQSVAATRAELESSRNGVAEQVGALKAHVAQAERHRKSAKGGNCPILNEPCRNVGGNLETYFIKEIEFLKDEMTTPQGELAEVETALKRAIEAAERLQELEHAQSQAIELAANIEQARESVAERRDELSWENWQELFSSFEFRVSSFESDEDNSGNLQPATRNSELIAFASELAECPTNDLALFQTLMEEFASRLRTVREGWLQSVRKAKKDAEEGYQTVFGELREARTVRRSLEEEQTKLSQREKQLSKDRTERDKLETQFASLERRLAEAGGQLEAYADVDALLQNVRETLSANESGHREYLQHRNRAEEREGIAIALQTAEELSERDADAEKESASGYDRLRAEWDESRLRAARSERERLVAEQATLKSDLASHRRELKDCQRRLAEMEERRREVATLDGTIEEATQARSLAQFVRDRMLNRAAERISRAYLRRVSESATHLYRHLSRENVHLEWMPDYEIRLKGGADGSAKERVFRQLSGGEQMSAALAVRLALLQLLSRLGIAIFDEPTTNLDESRRLSLAQQLPELRNLCRQVIVISHDDTFDSVVDEVIRLEKTAEGGSKRQSNFGG